MIRHQAKKRSHDGEHPHELDADKTRKVNPKQAADSVWVRGQRVWCEYEGTWYDATVKAEVDTGVWVVFHDGSSTRVEEGEFLTRLKRMKEVSNDGDDNEGEDKMCETCEKPDNGSYGSSRFCGDHCSRYFRNINKKLAKARKTSSLVPAEVVLASSSSSLEKEESEQEENSDDKSDGNESDDGSPSRLLHLIAPHPPQKTKKLSHVSNKIRKLFLAQGTFSGTDEETDEGEDEEKVANDNSDDEDHQSQKTKKPSHAGRKIRKVHPSQGTFSEGQRLRCEYEGTWHDATVHAAVSTGVWVRFHDGSKTLVEEEEFRTRLKVAARKSGGDNIGDGNGSGEETDGIEDEEKDDDDDDSDSNSDDGSDDDDNNYGDSDYNEDDEDDDDDGDASDDASDDGISLPQKTKKPPKPQKKKKKKKKKEPPRVGRKSSKVPGAGRGVIDIEPWSPGESSYAAAPTGKDVFKALCQVRLESIERKMVEPGGKGLTIGMLKRGQHEPYVSSSTLRRPNLTTLLTSWACASLPNNARYTTLQINFDANYGVHVDDNTVGDSWIIGLGDYEGGGFWQADAEGTKDIKGCWHRFAGGKPHASRTVTSGTRVSIVAFTLRYYLGNLKGLSCAHQIRPLGFRLLPQTLKEAAKAYRLAERKEGGNAAGASDDDDADDEEDEFLTTAESIIGRPVTKLFQGLGLFQGKVTDYDASTTWYTVVYEDGDEEEVNLSDLKKILVCKDINNHAGNDGDDHKYKDGGDDKEEEEDEEEEEEEEEEEKEEKKGEDELITTADSIIGRPVRKFFQGHGIFQGKVTAYNASTTVYTVVYEDDDEEEMYLSELKKWLV